MTEQSEMSPEREACIAAMRNMGWTVERIRMGKHPAFAFRRPDTGGLWDLVKVRKSNLSIRWVVETAIVHGDANDLADDINRRRQEWFEARFHGICQRSGVSA